MIAVSLRYGMIGSKGVYFTARRHVFGLKSEIYHKENVFRKLAVEFKRKYTRFCKYFDALVSSAKFVGLFHVGVKL